MASNTFMRVDAQSIKRCLRVFLSRRDTKLFKSSFAGASGNNSEIAGSPHKYWVFEISKRRLATFWQHPI